MPSPELFKNNNPNQVPWSSGTGEFVALHKYNLDFQPPIMVSCRIGSLPSYDLAMLDTGAQWSIIGGETLELIQGDLGQASDSIKISTRLGPMSCMIHELTVTLQAQWGSDLAVNSKVAVCNEWRGPLVLGFYGFLEILKIGIEPSISTDQRNLFYFGNRER